MVTRKSVKKVARKPVNKATSEQGYKEVCSVIRLVQKFRGSEFRKLKSTRIHKSVPSSPCPLVPLFPCSLVNLFTRPLVPL